MKIRARLGWLRAYVRHRVERDLDPGSLAGLRARAGTKAPGPADLSPPSPPDGSGLERGEGPGRLES